MKSNTTGDFCRDLLEEIHVEHYFQPHAGRPGQFDTSLEMLPAGGRRSNCPSRRTMPQSKKRTLMSYKVRKSVDGIEHTSLYDNLQHTENIYT